MSFRRRIFFIALLGITTGIALCCGTVHVLENKCSSCGPAVRDPTGNTYP